MEKTRRDSEEGPVQELARGRADTGGEGGIRTRGRGIYPFNSLANCSADSIGVECTRDCGEGQEALGLLLAQIDPKLADLVNAWPTLPGAIRAAILVMIEAQGGKREQE